MSKSESAPTPLANAAAFPNAVIRASAGTGKTFQLSNRYLGLLVAGVTPERILASTFTKKAAGEILERIVQRLALAAADESGAAKLAGELKLPSLNRTLAENLLCTLLSRLDRLQIGTLDSYFAKLARRFSLDLGLSPKWSILEATRDLELREEAIRRILQKGQAKELIHLLAKGETDRSISSLITNAVDELYSIYLSSEPSAWTGMIEKPHLDASALDETLSAVRDFPLEGAAISKARDKDIELWLTGTFSEFLGKGIARSVSTGSTKYSRTDIPLGLLALYERLIEEGVSRELQEKAAKLSGSKQLLDLFDQEYRALKHQEHRCQFDDVTRHLDDGLAAQPPHFDPLDTEQQIDHVLLDEFQDTSPKQWRVLNPVAESVVNHSDGSLLCVGDTKQAIYGWRGGVAAIFEEVIDWLGNRAESQRLVESYRSSQVIMDVVNQLFLNLNHHPDLGSHRGVVEWQRQFAQHESALSLSGYARLVGADSPLEMMADEVAAFHQAHPSYTIGVLVRANKTVGDAIHELGLRGVEASEESGKSLDSSWAVGIILSALKWLDHPGDSLARFHVARTPLGQMWKLESTAIPFPSNGNDELAAQLRSDLLHDGYGKTLAQWTQPLKGFVPEREWLRLGQLVDLAYVYDGRSTLRPSDFVRFVEAEKVSDPSSSKVRVMNIHQAKGLEFDVVYLPDLNHRLIGQPPSFVTHRDSPTAKVSRVRPYLNQQLQNVMPKSMLQDIDEYTMCQESESLCMLYVAMTRAARALHMIVPSPSPSAKKVSSTWAGLLLATLNDCALLKDSEVGYEHGTMDWVAQEDSLPEERLAIFRSIPLKPLEFAASPPESSRTLRRASPSSLEGGAVISARQLLQGGSATALAVGSAYHAVFEHLEWLAKDGTLPEVARHLAKHPIAPDSQSQLTNEIVNLLQSDLSKSILDKDEYLAWADSRWSGTKQQALHLEVHQEYGFATMYEGRLWSGFIDRLVWIKRGERVIGADIIDFKTDRIDTTERGSLESRVEHYRPQIDAYRKAVAKMARLDAKDVHARLWFVRAEKMVDL